MIKISGSLIWSKTLMELVKSTLLTSTLVLWDLFRSFKVCSDAEESGVRKAMGSYLNYSIPGKTAALGAEFTVEDLLLEELQPRFLCLQ